MVRFPPSALLLALAAGLASPAAEDVPSPLAESQQQLRQIERDRKTGAAAETGPGLKASLPTFAAPALASDAPAPPPPKSDSATAAGDKAAQPDNWLLAGYDRLQREEKSGGRNDPDATSRGPAGRDPAARNGDARPAETLPARPPGESSAQKAAARRELQATDPLAPFLKNWLAGSPVARPVWESLHRADGESGDRDWAAGDPATPPASDLDRLAGPQSDPASQLASAKTSGRLQDNPFLAGLDPVPDVADGGTAPATTSAGHSMPPVSPVPVATVLTPDKKENQTPPPDPRQEDRKYFPQLKRF